MYYAPTSIIREQHQTTGLRRKQLLWFSTEDRSWSSFQTLSADCTQVTISSSSHAQAPRDSCLPGTGLNPFPSFSSSI